MRSSSANHVDEVCRFRAVKMNLANEGLEAKKKEEEVSAKKRKAEEDANWEGRSTHSNTFEFTINLQNC